MDEKQKDEERRAYEERKEKIDNFGKNLQQGGNSMMGCGCLLTILVTLPILFILFF